jgi:4-hydroxy-tetrahydrodipicolinate synthase
MNFTLTRRKMLEVLGSAVLSPPLVAMAAGPKPLRGAFPIMATPYTETGAVDFEDLAGEVEFMVRCGVQGMVWPQSASEFSKLTRQERMTGMEILAKAGRGKKPALVLGVQGADTAEMLEYAGLAEKLAPDAVMAIPPANGKNLDEVRAYYRALAKAVTRPVFIQTSGGPKGLEPTTGMIVELATEFPNLGYVKEEVEPRIPRMLELARHRPVIKALFSGSGGWPYEMHLGFDGMMPGAPFADIYARLWELHEAGNDRQVRELFSKLALLTTLEAQIPGMRLYVMKKRGVFKTMVSRRTEFRPTPEATQEIDESLALLKPSLRA